MIDLRSFLYIKPRLRPPLEWLSRGYRFRQGLGAGPSRGILLQGFLLFCVLLPCGCGRSADLIVGSKNFTEQVILGELLARYLENELSVRVERKLNLAGTFLCHEALKNGEIDLYVEYTGTAFTAILRHDPSSDPQHVYQVVKRDYERRFGLEWTEPLGFNNTFAIMVRGADARRLGLDTISEVARYTPEWRAGFGYEFLARADGFSGLASLYGLRFAEAPREMDLGLMYRALNDSQVDLIAGNSTEGLVEALDLKVLEDDRGYFPPYQAAPVVNQLTLNRISGLRNALRRLADRISDESMRRMNYAVDGEGISVKVVVGRFLAGQGLLKKVPSQKELE